MNHKNNQHSKYPHTQMCGRRRLHAVPWFPQISDLPFDLQRHILDYAPRLPPLTTHFRSMLSNHFSSRYCQSCGRILPRRWREFHCLCRSRYTRHKFSEAINDASVYLRPKKIITAPTISVQDYNRAVSMDDDTLPYRYSHFVYVVSRQQEIVYSFRHLLLRQKIAKGRPRLCVNGSTCLRTPTDLFSTSLFGPLCAMGSRNYGHHFMSFCAYDIDQLWSMWDRRLADRDLQYTSMQGEIAFRNHDRSGVVWTHRSEHFSWDFEPLPNLVGPIPLKNAICVFAEPVRGGVVAPYKGFLPASARAWLSTCDLVRFLFTAKISGPALTFPSLPRMLRARL